MIDIKLIREKPELVRESLKKRVMNEKVVDELLALDEEWRNLKKQVDELRSQRNKISEEINLAKKSKEQITDLVREARDIPKNLIEKEKRISQLEKKRLEIWKNIPNLVDKSVPAGLGEKNKVLKKYGKTKKHEKGHAEIMESLDLIDTEKAGKVAGARFYYLKNELVKLNFAIINFAVDFLIKKGFIPIQTPYMLNRKALEGAITLDAFEEAIYKIENEDLYLIGTAEHAINALQSDEIIRQDKLPLRFVGFSTNFRKEAGAHGRDTKGIFRTHQFDKIEQFVFCKPEQAWKEFDLILNNSVQLYKALEIPFRVTLLAAGEASKTATKTIDLEGWYPSQGKYRELGSCSNCLDYQARRSNTRFQDKELKFVYTLNNTAIATERMMTCIVENKIEKSGDIKIPKALWKYAGFRVIKTKNSEKTLKKVQKTKKNVSRKA